MQAADRQGQPPDRRRLGGEGRGRLPSRSAASTPESPLPDSPPPESLTGRPGVALASERGDPDLRHAPPCSEGRSEGSDRQAARRGALPRRPAGARDAQGRGACPARARRQKRRLQRRSRQAQICPCPLPQSAPGPGGCIGNRATTDTAIDPPRMTGLAGAPMHGNGKAEDRLDQGRAQGGLGADLARANTPGTQASRRPPRGTGSLRRCCPGNDDAPHWAGRGSLKSLFEKRLAVVPFSAAKT